MSWFFTTGGTLHHNSPSYVERASDQQLNARLSERDRLLKKTSPHNSECHAVMSGPPVRPQAHESKEIKCSSAPPRSRPEVLPAGC